MSISSKGACACVITTRSGLSEATCSRFVLLHQPIFGWSLTSGEKSS
ncbi:MAG TPA: hypothetical protein VM864_16775 [Pyrinomonadaceae bacterium]|nr:hypothetical protein [Pyrinomonadaceae bacterium]